eukprot:TRINITY_DN587_c0_g1_i2.p1 TRINITY_DN587_c0_g1~~TRINITY_DN587_c0_g1_i2.p1  ORF type:complete len:164 (-),score=45.40 TRINITY_DN587_c0_g1_i2:237-728(-)
MSDTSKPKGEEKLAQLKKLGDQVRTGGKGTVRRKKKIPRKAATTDDKKLQATLRRMGLNPIPGMIYLTLEIPIDPTRNTRLLHDSGIDEVTFYHQDGNVRIFKTPKVQAAVAANTFVVTGQSTEKSLADLIPELAKSAGIPDVGSVNFEEVATKTEEAPADSK